MFVCTVIQLESLSLNPGDGPMDTDDQLTHAARDLHNNLLLLRALYHALATITNSDA